MNRNNNNCYNIWLKGFILFCLAWVGWCFSVEASQNVTIAWDSNPETNIAGYRVHYGTSRGEYTSVIDVGQTLSVTISNLFIGTSYFFAVTAYDTTALESIPSDEITYSPSPMDFRVGSYNGSAMTSSGGVGAQIALAVGKGGQFTGRLIIGNSNFTLRGKFSLDGSATVKLLASRQTPVLLMFQVAPEGGSVAVSVTNSAGVIPVALSWNPYSNSSPASEAGKYTSLLGKAVAIAETESTSQNAVPPGRGWATIVVTNFGAVRVTGRLSDETPFTLVSNVKPDGHFVIHKAIYSGQSGSLSGEVAIRDIPAESDGDGMLRWTKPAQNNFGFYSQGLNATLPIKLSRFLDAKNEVNAAVAPPLPALATLSEGGLPQATPIQHSLSPQFANLAVLNPAYDRLRLGIGVGSGLVTGSFIHWIDGRARPISGVLFQKTGTAGGYFPGLQTTGAIDIKGLPTF